ncbi:MAG TPA: hypothetical protein VM285_15845 [Polyangia bacterium]|nr:hypothetical protein [Polyangia bacterium]
MSARTTALAVAFWLAAGCGDAGITDYFEPEGDSDIGGANDLTADSGTQQPTGDPCAEDSPWPCHPVTGAGCDGDDSGCDFGLGGGVWGFFCFSDCTEPLGASCDQAVGPWCASGMTCRGGVCSGFCCLAEDCPEGIGCVPGNWDPPLEAGPGFCEELP